MSLLDDVEYRSIIQFVDALETDDLVQCAKQSRVERDRLEASEIAILSWEWERAKPFNHRWASPLLTL